MVPVFGYHGELLKKAEGNRKIQKCGNAEVNFSFIEMKVDINWNSNTAITDINRNLDKEDLTYKLSVSKFSMNVFQERGGQKMGFKRK